MTTSSLDHWRGFFRAAGDSDIFHVIRQAIRIAASDHPDEFRSRRDEIAQTLFVSPRRDEKADEGRGNAVQAIEEKEDDGRRNAVKAIEKKEDDGRGNAFKSIEVKSIEEREEDSGRGNAVKSNGALFPPQTPRAELNPAGAAVSVDEEKADTRRQETWKVLVTENGKIRLRRVLHDETKPQRTSTEHQPEPRNQEGSLPTFTEQQPVSVSVPVPVPVIDPSTEHPQGRFQRTTTKPVIAVAGPEPPRLPNMREDDASLRSKSETAKRKLREGYQQTENAKRQRRIQVIQPREIPKDCNKKPLLFKSLGTWLR